jgi:AraC family transcriptional regulator of adaptative response / DNA-3-methyladenine glycosylase II
VLLETTDLPSADVAFAAGFASVRQFNETIQSIFATTPTGLRAKRARGQRPEAGTITLRLPYRTPMDLSATIEFLAHRAIPRVESGNDAVFRRTLRAPGGPALVEISPGDGCVACRVRLSDQRDLVAVVSRIRRLLDLDADPEAVDATLCADPSLAPLVAKRPGLRSPGAVDGFEMAVRAVVGQQVSVRAAATVLDRLVNRYGEIAFDGEPWRLFPTPAALAGVDPNELPMPRARGRTIARVAEEFAAGTLVLDPGTDRDEARAALLALPGIGAWTADYVRMRALSDPDVALVGDLGVRASAEALGVRLDGGRPDWAPWRSYATHHLWAAAH